MRVLITGIAGHIGSSFASWLIEHRPDVAIIGIDNLSSGFRENVPAGVEFTEADLCDPVPEFGHIDYVFHFAAFAAECLSPFVRSHSLRNTALATTNLINWAIRQGTIRRFVFTSSIAAVGQATPPFSEEAVCRPIDPYGAGKLFSEIDLRIAGEQHGLSWTILRPHNIYGPGQNLWDRHRNVFGLWMRAALEVKPLRIFGDGLQERAFSYIDDVVPCFWAAATRDQAAGQIINLGGEEPVTILQAAQAIREAIGPGLKIEQIEPRHEVKRAWSTVEKSQRMLGYVERTSLRDGLAAMWAWAQEAWHQYPERRRMKGPEVEVEQGLYAPWRLNNS